MSEYWQELKNELGGSLAVEGEVSLLFGELPTCEFTVLGNRAGAHVIQLDFSEGEDPEKVRERLAGDETLARKAQGAGLQLNGETAFFMPEQLNWYLRSQSGKPPGARIAAELVGCLAATLTAGAPLRDRFCWGCGELECGLTRHKESTVRLCPACLDMLDNCGQELGRLEKTELEPDDELDLSPLGLENISAKGQLARGRRLAELFRRHPGQYWLRVLFLVILGQLALFGAAIALTLIILSIVGLGVWSVVSGHALFLVALGKILGAGGVKAVAALLVLLGFAAKTLWPPKIVDKLPDILLRREDQPEFFGWLDDLGNLLGAPPVDLVAVDNQINAFASERRMKGRWVRTVGVGVPLLELLSKAELSAVMAHELGHLSHKDTRTLWVNRTAWMWASVISRLGSQANSVYTWFARWYLPEFWLYSQVLARQQEREADQASARVVPAEAQARQMVRIELLCRLLPEGLHESLNQAARENREVTVDPIRMAAAQLQEMSPERVAEAYKDALEEGPNWLSTHPELKQRLADLGVAPPATVDAHFAPADPASSLLRGYPELRERAVRPLTVKCQVRLNRERRFYRGRTARAERLSRHEATQGVSAAGQVLIGRLLLSLQRREEAWERLRVAVGMEPGNLHALLDLAGSLFEERRYFEALQDLQAFLPADALDVDLLSIGARSAEKCGQPEAAREYYRRLLTMDLPLVAREDIQNRLEAL